MCPIQPMMPFTGINFVRLKPPTEMGDNKQILLQAKDIYHWSPVNDDTIIWCLPDNFIYNSREKRWIHAFSAPVNVYTKPRRLNYREKVQYKGYFQQMHFIYRLIGLIDRVFANGPGDLGSIPGRVIPKTLKRVLDTSLLNTQ